MGTRTTALLWVGSFPERHTGRILGLRLRVSHDVESVVPTRRAAPPGRGRCIAALLHQTAHLSVKRLLRDQYDTAARLASFDRPVVVIVTGQDSIVPPRFGVALHAAPDGPKHLMQIDGARHNDGLDRVDSGGWRKAMDLAQ